jgi:CCR4-NOT transcription complex subunit 6
LDLGGIHLKTLSPAIFAFAHITALYVNHNNLTALPPGIGRLRHLTILDATANELTAIPAEIGCLFNLTELLLFDNHITTLPSEVGMLFKLVTLGIEGNPIEERLRKMIADDGTEALVAHFRDNSPVTTSPPERQWVDVDADIDSPSSGKQESFTVLTYNILCSHFATTAMYKYTPNWALDWNYRKQTILNELTNASADVVCLQEVDVATYSEYLLPALQEHGYEGTHYPRSRAKTMTPEEQAKVDGCCIFWKAEK